jgi:hypothetical protein
MAAPMPRDGAGDQGHLGCLKSEFTHANRLPGFIQRGRIKQRGAGQFGVDALDHARQHLAGATFDHRG